LSTGTNSTTFSRTNARHIASKIAADLRQMRLLYGKPSPEQIDEYNDEIVEFLVKKWVKTVEYGFKRDGEWVVSLRYEVRADGTIDDTGAGRVYPGADIAAASFHSFMTYTDKYYSDDDRESVLDKLPFRRTPGTDPAHVNGYWETGKSYASGGYGAVRSQWRPQ
jgi:hypothetical protein